MKFFFITDRHNFALAFAHLVKDVSHREFYPGLRSPSCNQNQEHFYGESIVMLPTFRSKPFRQSGNDSIENIFWNRYTKTGQFVFIYCTGDSLEHSFSFWLVPTIEWLSLRREVHHMEGLKSFFSTYSIHCVCKPLPSGLS